MDEELNDIAKKFVDSLTSEFDKKGLNDTFKGRDSISYKIESRKIIIEGLARVLFLVYGRAPGTPPPFGVIRDWVIRKLNPEEGAVWIITKTIVDKIAEKGTDIFRDKAKGLEIELLLQKLNDELLLEITIFEQARITNGLIKTWQSPN
jgi:hypothetical protein